MCYFAILVIVSHIQFFIMTSSWIIRMLKYYSLWGFHSIPFIRFGGNRMNLLIGYGQVLLCVWYMYIAFSPSETRKTLMLRLDVMNFSLYFITCIITCWLIFYDSYTKQAFQIKFWKQIMLVEQGCFEKMKLYKWIYLVTLALIIFIDTFIFVFALLDKSSSDLKGKMVHFIFLCITDNRTMFYILHLETIAYQLRKIEIQLKRLKVHNFRLFRKNYALVYEMSNYINSIFGLSHLALILISFHTSVTFLCLLYRQVNKQISIFSHS